ncbi:MAG: HD domain-containing protein [Acholeplasmataceae bacterium]|nr:HD domain-containing protein [Acholeplasmataceae bacterium]MCK9288791.1 HD domain-containing protein [Acholeplasmataceae bacterium]HHT39697.1 HD domain-containing protein [Acholeplasmataceae bacterium]
MTIVGKVENMNVGSDYFNCNVVSNKGERLNLKLTKEQASLIKVEQVYHFKYQTITINEKVNYQVTEFTDVLNTIDNLAEAQERLAPFYQFAPLEMSKVEAEVEGYLNKITNPILIKITKNLYQKYKKEFYLYPAAVKFHHAYVGGLAYHTKTMLKIAEKLLEVYDFINQDLVYSAIILHDLCKTKELTSLAGGEYTKEGQLIGHLVLISGEVMIEASKHNLEKSEEVLQLNHILLAHHGLPHFGAAKRPQTAEALLVWYIDTIDSKFRVIEESLKEVAEGEFTSIINVADKMRYYKHKVK